MAEKKTGETKFIGFNAEPDVQQIIRKMNDQIYKQTGRSNQSAAINQLIRIAGNKKDVRNI